MEGQFSAPFHFAVEFLVLIVAVGAAFDSLRLWKHGGGRWALGQALGFLALAAAQVGHGALIAQAEADVFVVGARGLAFVLLAVFARPGLAGASGMDLAKAAPITVPALFVPGATPGYAAVPGLASLAVAFRGARAHRYDQDPATFAFAAAFVGFALAEGAAVLSPSGGGGWLIAAHVCRALAALLLARWLWTSIVRSVRRRFVAAFVVVLTVLVLVLSAALNIVIGNTLETEELKRLQDAGRSRVATVRTLAESAAGAASSLATERVADRFRAGDATYFRGLAAGGIRLIPAQADVLQFVNSASRTLASMENATAPEEPRPLPRSQELAIAGAGVVTEVLRDGRVSASAEPVTYSSDGREVREVIVVGAAPARQGRTVRGAVVIVYRIDEAFLAEVARDTGAEATLIQGDQVAATTLANPAAVQRALRPVLGSLRIAREENRAESARLSIGGLGYLTEFVPLQSEDGQVIALLALSRRSAVLADAQRSITRTLFLITLLAVMIASILAWLSGGRVTKPIRALTAAARELREGNLDARARVASSDEVGTLGTAFNEMADELQRKTGALTSAAVEEAALRSRMEAIVQSMGDGLVAIDADGVVVTFNRAAEQMFGRKAEKVVGRKVSEVMTGTAAAGRSLADAAMKGGATEGTLARAGGSPVPVALSSAPLLDADGKPIGRVVLLRDMSREHEAERMKTEFLSNVSHELRTPITPIKGYAEILARKKFPREKTEQFLEGIIESTERLERIVEILVDFSAMEAGRLKPRQEPVSVKELLDEAIARWRAKSGEHQFVRRATGDMPPIRGDARLLARSLNELIDNAVKFSPDGGRIEIGAEAETNGGRGRRPTSVRIVIKDHGIGIAPEQLPDLFQDFRQLDGSETRAYGGLGLGLAYVKRIMGVHGGDVTVESRPGKGSTFILMLPVADTSQGGKGATSAPSRRPASAKAAPAKSARRSMKAGVLNIRRPRR